MNKLLISTALAGLLAASGAAFAQDRHKDDGHPGPGGGGPAPAAHTEAPRGGPGGHHDDHRAGPPAAARATPPATGRPDHFTNGARPGDHGPDNRGNPGARSNGPANGPARSAGPRQNFSAFNRNISAPRRFHAPSSYRRPSGWYARRWSYGQILPALFWAPDYWINDFYDYALAPPPPGTVWVRDGDDALLIDRYSGEIIQVDYGVFY